MTPHLASYLRAMPKVELHVHLEGSIRPETLLELSHRNHVPLPYHTVPELRQWYVFRDFPHFVEIYTLISRCLKSGDDIELIAREFLAGQAEQNIQYSEPTYTAYTILEECAISFDDQFAALERARRWGERELGVTMNVIVDIAREESPAVGMLTADQVIQRHGKGVCALGLGGYEVDNPPEKFRACFDKVNAAGIPCILHAGETGGPDSIWGALRVGNPRRIGHGVRCLEDPALVKYLLAHQIPLEVCPTSNVCLNVAPSIQEHPIQALLDKGMYITLNSDDPPMFNTTLTDEYLKCTDAFGWEAATAEKLVLNGLAASLLSAKDKMTLEQDFRAEFARLRNQYNIP